MDLKELYQEIILDHGKNPRNKGKCNGYTNDAKAHNPLCGDKVHIYLKLNVIGQWSEPRTEVKFSAEAILLCNFCEIQK